MEEYTEINNEVKLAKITLAENENKYKCSSCTLIIVLLSIVFTISVRIGTNFVYYKYMNRNKETDCRYNQLDTIYSTYKWGKSKK